LSVSLVAVRPQDVAIQDDHVVVVGREPVERGVAIERDIRSDRFVAEPGLERLREEKLIFDNQYVHPGSSLHLVRAQCKGGHVAEMLGNSHTLLQHADG
jgi:hypothetical protein